MPKRVAVPGARDAVVEDNWRTAPWKLLKNEVAGYAGGARLGEAAYGLYRPESKGEASVWIAAAGSGASMDAGLAAGRTWSKAARLTTVTADLEAMGEVEES
jgi:hypothetical protein